MPGAAQPCTKTSRGWNSTWTPASGVCVLLMCWLAQKICRMLQAGLAVGPSTILCTVIRSYCTSTCIQ